MALTRALLLPMARPTTSALIVAIHQLLVAAVAAYATIVWMQVRAWTAMSATASANQRVSAMMAAVLVTALSAMVLAPTPRLWRWLRRPHPRGSARARLLHAGGFLVLWSLCASVATSGLLVAFVTREAWWVVAFAVVGLTALVAYAPRRAST